MSGVEKYRYRRSACSTEGLFYRTARDPNKLCYLHGSSGRTIALTMPPGGTEGRLVASPRDLFVVAGSTFRYNLRSRKWRSIPGLDPISVSGNGIYGLFARKADRRMVVKKLN